MSLTEEQKKAYRDELGRMEAQTIRHSRKRLSTDDFDPLAIIGRGAFGEVKTPLPPSPPSSLSRDAKRFAGLASGSWRACCQALRD